MRLLVISPVRNEVAHIDRLGASVAAQTRPPDLWVIADDGSDDGTRDRLSALRSEIPFLRVVDVPQRGADVRDRLAHALEARAFNHALESLDWREYTHIGKVDGDVELPPPYFERLLAEFERDGELGIIGGTILEQRSGSGGWVRATAPAYHVDGALKLYSRRCFEMIGGIRPMLGWDTIDETYARMHGFATRRSDELEVRHHRVSGSADGSLRGAARHGECAYVARYSFTWTALRSFKIAAIWRPRVISGLAFAGGYLRGMLLRRPRVEDSAFKRFVRVEHRRRLREAAAKASGAGLR